MGRKRRDFEGRVSFFFLSRKKKTETFQRKKSKLTHPLSSARSAARNSSPPYRPLSAAMRSRCPPGSQAGDAGEKFWGEVEERRRRGG